MKKIFTLLLATQTLLSVAQTAGWSWANKLSGPRDEKSYRMTIDKDNHIYTTGEFETKLVVGTNTIIANGGANKDGVLVKYDGNGNVLKTLTCGSAVNAVGVEERITCVTVDTNKNVYIAGYFNRNNFVIGAGTGSASINLITGYTKALFISKLDSNFNVLWAKPIFSGSIPTAQQLKVDASGNPYLVGRFDYVVVDTYTTTGTYYPGFEGMSILKFNTNGILQWYKHFKGSGVFSSIEGIAFDTNDEPYVIGSFQYNAVIDTYSFTVTGTNCDDSFLAKLSKNTGNINWLTPIISNTRDMAKGITISPNNEVYVGGFFGTSYYNYTGTLTIGSQSVIGNNYSGDLFLFKSDTAGNVLWLKKYGGISSELFKAITLDHSNNVVMTGQGNANTNFGTGFMSEEIFVAKVDNNGNTIYAKSAGKSSSSDLVSDICADSYDNVYINGIFNNNTLFGTYNLIADLTYGTSSTDMFCAKLSTSAIPTSLGEANLLHNNVVAYPNPAHNTISVRFSVLSNTTEKNEIKIYGVLGNLISSTVTDKNEISIDVSTLPNGIYFMQIENNERVKFIKE